MINGDDLATIFSEITYDTKQDDEIKQVDDET